MRILLYGATGTFGAPIAAEAVSRGHEVTAVTRSGTPVEGAEACVAADFMDFPEYSRLVVDHDAVVFAVPPSRTGGSHEPFLEAHRHIARSMAPARVLLVGHSPDGSAEALTMAAADDAYEASENLDWTVAVPGAAGPDAFATALLDEVEDFAHRNETYTVGA